MNTKGIQLPKLEAEIGDLSTGLIQAQSTLLYSLMVLGRPMAKADVITKLQGYLRLFTAVSDAKKAYVAAFLARKAAMPEMVTFIRGLVVVLKHTLGPDNQAMLGTFGIAPPTVRQGASVETKALAKLKAAATRKARGMMTKAQRMAIKPVTNIGLQVTGAEGVPLAEPTSSAAPSPVGTTTPNHTS